MQQNLTVGVPMYSLYVYLWLQILPSLPTLPLKPVLPLQSVLPSFPDTPNTGSAASASLAASAANAANSLKTHKVKHGRKFEKKRQIERKNSFFGVLHDTLLI